MKTSCKPILENHKIVWKALHVKASNFHRKKTTKLTTQYSQTFQNTMEILRKWLALILMRKIIHDSRLLIVKKKIIHPQQTQPITEFMDTFFIM